MYKCSLAANKKWLANWFTIEGKTNNSFATLKIAILFHFRFVEFIFYLNKFK